MKKKYWVLSVFSLIVMMVIFTAKIIYTNTIEELVQKEITQIAPLLPWGEISYEDLKTNYKGDITIIRPRVHNLKTGRLIQADILKIKQYDSIKTIPQHIEFVIEGLRFPIIPDNTPTEGAVGFIQLGMKQLFLSVKLRYHYDDLSRQAFFYLQLELDEIADIDWSLQLANVDIEQLKYYWRNPDEILLMKAHFNYTEKGLLSRYVKYQAKQMGLPESEFMAQVNKRLEITRQEASDKKLQHIADFYQTWQTFIQDFNLIQQKKQLRVSVAKTEGLSLSTIKKLIGNDINKEVLASLLNFKATVN